MTNAKIGKIISGGQTGVDRAGLDVAMELGIPIGGYCPKGRHAEDGTIPAKYNLTELSSSGYHVRTEKNVKASDATLILYLKELVGGSKLTYNLALKHKKPVLALNIEDDSIVSIATNFLRCHNIQTLNIAGPRESYSGNQVYTHARAILLEILRELKQSA
jgi:predicted Rossmann-fold nucleotide-binding protein